MQDYIDGAAPPISTVRLRIEGNEAFNGYDASADVTSWVLEMEKTWVTFLRGIL